MNKNKKKINSPIVVKEKICHLCGHKTLLEDLFSAALLPCKRIRLFINSKTKRELELCEDCLRELVIMGDEKDSEEFFEVVREEERKRLWRLEQKENTSQKR